MGCCKHGGTDGDCLDCLRDEVAELRGALYDEQHGISFHARDAELQRLTAIESASRNLVAQKGRHNTEIAYRRLVEALTPNVKSTVIKQVDRISV